MKGFIANQITNQVKFTVQKEDCEFNQRMLKLFDRIDHNRFLSVAQKNQLKIVAYVSRNRERIYGTIRESFIGVILDRAFESFLKIAFGL